MQESAHFKGFSLAIIASVLWGISGTFAQFLFQRRGINVEWLITTRMLVAGFLLLLIAGFNKNPDLWNIWKTKKYFNKIKAPKKSYYLLPKTAHGFNLQVLEAQYKIFKRIKAL